MEHAITRFNGSYREGWRAAEEQFFFKKRTQTTQKNSQDEQPKEDFFEKRICNILISECTLLQEYRRGPDCYFFYLISHEVIN